MSRASECETHISFDIFAYNIFVSPQILFKLKTKIVRAKTHALKKPNIFVLMPRQGRPNSKIISFLTFWLRKLPYRTPMIFDSKLTPSP